MDQARGGGVASSQLLLVTVVELDGEVHAQPEQDRQAGHRYEGQRDAGGTGDAKGEQHAHDDHGQRHQAPTDGEDDVQDSDHEEDGYYGRDRHVVDDARGDLAVEARIAGHDSAARETGGLDRILDAPGDLALLLDAKAGLQGDIDQLVAVREELGEVGGRLAIRAEDDPSRDAGLIEAHAGWELGDAEQREDARAREDLVVGADGIREALDLREALGAGELRRCAGDHHHHGIAAEGPGEGRAVLRGVAAPVHEGFLRGVDMRLRGAEHRQNNQDQRARQNRPRAGLNEASDPGEQVLHCSPLPAVHRSGPWFWDYLEAAAASFLRGLLISSRRRLLIAGVAHV